MQCGESYPRTQTLGPTVKWRDRITSMVEMMEKNSCSCMGRVPRVSEWKQQTLKHESFTAQGVKGPL